jgi:hypothetical protein
MLIQCNFGDQVWLDCVEKYHSNQIRCQILVTGFKYCVYIVARPGTVGAKENPIYMVLAVIQKAQFYASLSYLSRKMNTLLSPFFRYNNVDYVINNLPLGLGDNEQEIIQSRWPFFHKIRIAAIECKVTGFAGCSLFKTSFQSLYNVVKGGLDANTQQYISICLNVKLNFKQKYEIRLLLAIVSYSWRKFQLLQMDSNKEELQFSQVRKKLQNSKLKLTKFCFDLAMALTWSADDRSANNVLRASEAMEPSNTRAISTAEVPTEFERDPATLRDRLAGERWPLRYKVKVFNRTETIIEL